MSQSPFNSPFDIDVEYFSSRFEIKGGRASMLRRVLFRARPLLDAELAIEDGFSFSKGESEGL